MMPMYAINSSFVRLPAAEVFRLAIASIAEIQSKRQKFVEKAIEASLEVEDTSFMGLVKTKRYADRQEALEHSKAVDAAQQVMKGAEDTCELFRDMARYLMDNPIIKDDDKYINLTMIDYRVLK